MLSEGNRPGRWRLMFCLVVIFVAWLLPELGLSHEQWVLTPEQMAELNAKPSPPIFTEINATNIAIVTAASVFLVGWILLGFTGARELFPDLQVRLASYGPYSAMALRIALSIMLGMAAFGLGPRAGTGLMEAPVLAAPDLELRLVGEAWYWIAWAEAIIALCLLLGIYVRAMAAAILVLGVLGLALYGYAMVAYIGLVGGAAIYLLLQGAGQFFIPMPLIPGTRRIYTWLADQPRARAQFLLRILAGLNLLYLGVDYKFLQPNLALEMIVRHEIPTVGLDAATFVFFMAIVESLSGLLILAGILIRPLSFFLLGSFLFFSVLLGESAFSHIIFYGLLVSFLTNAAGRWRRPVATDQPGRIVILGASFAGMHSALRLERLLGQFTNVRVTIVHQESYFLFQPLLTEVVGGAIQPGNIVNPIRRICPRTEFLHGDVAAIDPQCREVTVRLEHGAQVRRPYDQLIVALDDEADFSDVPGLLEHAFPIMTIGDGLRLRQQVLESLEQAEYAYQEAGAGGLREMETYVVVGGDVLGCATAAEVHELLQAALVSFSSLKGHRPRVVMVSQGERLLAGLEPAVGQGVQCRLKRMGIEVRTGTRVEAVTADSVVLDSGERIRTRTVVATIRRSHHVIGTLPGVLPNGRLPVDEHLRLRGVDGVFAVGSAADPGDATPLGLLRAILMGRLVAYNAYAAIQGFRLHAWRSTSRWFHVLPMGRSASVMWLLGGVVGGFPAWMASRLLCLLTLPGLERNLRILIDWLLDIPFRNDIVVLTPHRTRKVSRAHFEQGDVIFRQGDSGDFAYVINAGQVEVLRSSSGREDVIAVLGAGNCFGEIALLSDCPRTATIRCRTAVDVTVLPRDQLAALSEGYRELDNALHSGMSERLEQLGIADQASKPT